jgi:hypothetical protein
MRPIFTGGTGRSGTTITGYLIGSHPEIWSIEPIEIRFLTDRGGLLDTAFVADSAHQRRSRRKRVTDARDRLLGRYAPPNERQFRDFMAKMRGHWYLRHGVGDHRCRGLHKSITLPDLDAALQSFERGFATSPVQSSSTLLHELFDARAAARGATAWVDTTPHNAIRSRRIAELMPDARIVHMIRDGRDAGMSVVSMPWGPKDPLSALEWWRWRVLQSHQAMSEIPAQQSHTIVFEELVSTNRDATLQGLFDFLGYDVAPEVRAYFDGKMPASRAHVHRWLTDVPADLLPEFERTYAQMHQDLTAEGVPLPPL